MIDETYNTVATSRALAFALKFADSFWIPKIAGGIQYPNFHPESDKVSAQYPSDGVLIVPRDNSFDHLYVAAFPIQRKFEIGIHFKKQAPALMDLIHFFGTHGRFFLYDEVIEKKTDSPRYENELYVPDLERMMYSCYASNNVAVMVKLARKSEIDNKVNTHKRILPTDKVGYYIATTGEFPAARLYAAALVDIAKRTHQRRTKSLL